MVVKLHQDKHIINKGLGVNLNDKKDLLCMWLLENEGAKFWSDVLTKLQNCRVQDILIAYIDSLKGLPDAIITVYSKAQVQLCIVHMLRYSMKFVTRINKKAVSADIKAIYGADTIEPAKVNLEHFDEVWGKKYPHVFTSWRNNWEGLMVFFDYRKDIRKAICTNNAIESLSSVIWTAVNEHRVFPYDLAAFKVVYLATQ